MWLVSVGYFATATVLEHSSSVQLCIDRIVPLVSSDKLAVVCVTSRHRKVIDAALSSRLEHCCLNLF